MAVAGICPQCSAFTAPHCPGDGCTGEWCPRAKRPDGTGCGWEAPPTGACGDKPAAHPWELEEPIDGFDKRWAKGVRTLGRWAPGWDSADHPIGFVLDYTAGRPDWDLDDLHDMTDQLAEWETAVEKAYGTVRACPGLSLDRPIPTAQPAQEAA
ncbi:MAG TPA: hypothetical protein VKV25_06370 [Acidimicrobiales bacterium]|nr:hypothetical protein [Acidimicrobiales bacterium]